MPMGYGPSMRVFTKVLKPPFAHLRSMNLDSVVYVDDNLLLGRDKESCQHNISTTVSLLKKLGFTIHVDKSVLVPSQEITFLGRKRIKF